MGDARIVERAGCKDCLWEDISGSRMTPANAQNHANQTEHTVWVEYSVIQELVPRSIGE